MPDRAGAEAFSRARPARTAIPTHVVPAFRLRDGTAFSSDAGEPAGSAGAPLLAALGGAGLVDVAAVVVRWYGGTELGVGGLVRAYGGALAKALDGRAARALRARARGAAGLRPRADGGRHALRRGARRRASGCSTTARPAPSSAVSFRSAGVVALERCVRDATRGAVSVEQGGAVIRDIGQAPS